jgi:hypothetical protein
MPELTPSAAPSPSRWALFLRNPWSYPLLACFLLIALLSLRKVGTYDLGFHLKAGQWIVQHLAYPQKDSFTYTQTNRDYLDSNGLYQIVLYGLFKIFGYSSLTLFNTCIIWAVFIILCVRLGPTTGAPWIAPILLLAAAACMERRFIVRPEVFSWLYLSLTLWILDQRFAREKSFIFLLPLIQWLWVNSEGLFPLGWAAIGAYLLGGWYHNKRMDWPLARHSFLSIVVGFLNPYWAKGLLFPLVLWARLQDSSPYKQTIAEFFSPWHALKVQNLGFDSHFNLFLFFIVALAGLAALTLTFRRRNIQDFLLYLIFLFLALKAIRNIPLFMLIALPILSASWDSQKASQRWERLVKPSMAFVLSIFILLWCLRVLTNAYYINDRRNDRIGLGVDSQVLPVKAAQFLQQNGLDGKMLNDLDSGGWLDWQAPQPTFMDGRLEVPEDFFYQQVMASFNPGGLIPLLAATDAQLAVLEYNSASPWVDQLNRFSNWRLIYLDECTAIYARWDYAPQIPPLLFSTFLTSRGISDVTDNSMETQLRNLKPSKLNTWSRGFYQPQAYAMGDFSMGLFALRLKSYGPARDLLVGGWRQTNGDYPEVFFNLAVANLHLQDAQSGRLCLGYTLQLDPQNQEASQMLMNMDSMSGK